MTINRLTGDIVSEIRSFLDHESFYRWILACHVVTLKSDDNGSSFLKSGRPMIRNWLSKYVDFPIEKIHFGGTQGYQRLLEVGGLSTDPKWLGESDGDYGRTPQKFYDVHSVPGPSYFLDMISDHCDDRWDRSRSSNKEANWFKEVIPNTREVLRSNKWFESPTYYSCWQKLWFIAERILRDAIIHNEYEGNDCLKQYPLLIGLQRQGCVELPPHDRMFALPSVLVQACLDHDELMTSVSANSSSNCNLANSLTVLDVLTGEGHGTQWSYWGEKVPRWAMTRNDPSAQLVLRWSFHQDTQRNAQGDRGGEDDNNNNVIHDCIPWCGSSETSKQTCESWKRLRANICIWIDNRLEEFDHEMDKELTKAIVSGVILSDDLGDTIEVGKDSDDYGETLMGHLVAKENEASMWADNKEIRVKRTLQKIKRLVKEDLARWKKHFSGSEKKNKQKIARANLSNQNSNDQEFATWQSIGLSNRLCLRFDPVQFNDWLSKTITSVNDALTKATLYCRNLPSIHETRTASQSAISLLQFAAEDLGLGLSWKIEGKNGEEAAMLLGPHGSIWMKQKDSTILEHFCCSDDDDESYCNESSDNSSPLTCTQDDPSKESTEEPTVRDIQDDDNEATTEEPVAKRQKLTTSVPSPNRIPAPNDLQRQLLDKMEAMEKEVANLKATNTNLKKELKTHVENVAAGLQGELTEMRTANESKACEVQILKTDLHQTRLDLAKAQQQLASIKRTAP